ncbi:MAG: DUF2500 family protein [Lachnospiraceae bacterium]|nr:DUF2500 family protein [Lachnospiraceae bacterium]
MVGVEVTWFEHSISLLFVAFICIVFVVICGKEVKEHRGKKKVEVPATLLSKHIEQNTAQTMYKTTRNCEAGVMEIRHSCRLLFCIVGDVKRELEFEVSREMYDKVQENNQGILIYRGHELICFDGIQNYGGKGGKFISLEE